MLFFCKHVWKAWDVRSPGYSHELEYKIRADPFNALYALTDVSDDQNTQELRRSTDFKGICISSHQCQSIPRKKGGWALKDTDSECTDAWKEPVS